MVPCAMRWLLQTVTLSCGNFSDVTTRLKSCGIRTRWSIFCCFSFTISNMFDFNFFLSDCPFLTQFEFSIFFPFTSQKVYRHMSLLVSFFNNTKTFFIAQPKLHQSTESKDCWKCKRIFKMIKKYKNVDRWRTTWLFHLILSTTLCVLAVKITNILPWPSEWRKSNTASSANPYKRW